MNNETGDGKATKAGNEKVKPTESVDDGTSYGRSNCRKI
jgi:hypothetical protein